MGSFGVLEVRNERAVRHMGLTFPEARALAGRLAAEEGSEVELLIPFTQE